MVCRSASTWQGWNWSVSALITGTVAAEASASMRSCPEVRQAIAATCRVSTRATSSIVSPRPICVVAVSMTTGKPPSSAIPTVNDTRVRSDCLSNSTATARGPASGCQPNLSFFTRSASSRTAACSVGDRSSSRRKCLVTS